MLKSIQEALRTRKNDDKGFSLVELGVVIVIIGILVAIAVPVFAGIQDGAKKAAVESAAANGSAIMAGEIASSATSALNDAQLTALNTAVGAVGKLKTGDMASVVATGTTLDEYCVTAIGSGYTATKGTGTCLNTTTKP